MDDTDLRLYDVIVDGHKTNMRLNDADAAAMGTAAVLAGSAAAVPKPVDPHLEVKGRPVTSNKMRGTNNGEGV